MNEYDSLRAEINQRILLLHQSINLASIVSFLSVLFFIFVLNLFENSVVIFLLIIPVIFGLLVFNYQANQMTLEAVAKYLQEKYKQSDWDNYYGDYKKKVRLTSFLKVMPFFIIPLSSIVIVFFYEPIYWQKIWVYLDIALELLVIYNFKYKISK